VAMFKKKRSFKKLKRFLYEKLLISDLPEKERKNALLIFIMLQL